MITTEAWVLHRGKEGADPFNPEPAELSLEEFSFGDLEDHEVLVEPLVGCWEANMTHALERSPIDVCRARGEERMVLGNGGVVRVLKTGADVTKVKVGDLTFVACIGVPDDHGFVKLVHGYDAPGTVGVLAKQTKLPEHVAVPLPVDSEYSPAQWSTYARYWTAWSNWKVAYGCWKTQMSHYDEPAPLAFGWGGGVSIAQLELAVRNGFRAAMTCSSPARAKMIEAKGITAIDRRKFPDLYFDPWKFGTDAEYTEKYKASEEKFLHIIAELSGGQGAAILIDNIGVPVYRASLRALARQGVIATSGWKAGMKTDQYRAKECIGRHIHVHTHACRYDEAREASSYQQSTGWLPEVDAPYAWEDIPKLAADYQADSIDSYFPVFQVNPA